MFDLFSVQMVLLASSIVFFAFMVRGLTGFGSGPVMVPLLLFFIDIKIVVPVAAVHAVLTGCLLLFTFQTRKFVRKDLFYILIPGGIVGTVAGSYILTSFRSDILKILFGLFVIAFSLHDLFLEAKRTVVAKEAQEAKTYRGLFAGFLGGITGGLFASAGPPIVMYLTRKLKDKNAFRATLVLYFLVQDPWRLIAYAGTGLMSWDILKFSLVLIPAMVAGNFTGSALVQRVNQVLFRRIVSLVLLGIGVALLF